MRMLFVALVAALALAGCQTTEIDQAVQRSLPQICSASKIAHTAFVAATAGGTIKESVIAKEAAAYAGLEVICTDPANATTADILVRAATAYAIVAGALRTAERS